MERLWRSQTERVFSGLAAALARALRVPPVVVRAAFIVLAVASGLGIILYALGTLLVRQEGTRAETFDDVLRENLRSAVRELGATWRTAGRLVGEWRARRSYGDPIVRRSAVVGAGFVVLGLIWLLGSLDLFDWLTLGRFFALSFVGVGVYVLAVSSSR
jgi:phage shock protein PspC (stress-responsive transcriptional regulator)